MHKREVFSMKGRQTTKANLHAVEGEEEEATCRAEAGVVDKRIAWAAVHSQEAVAVGSAAAGSGQDAVQALIAVGRVRRAAEGDKAWVEEEAALGSSAQRAPRPPQHAHSRTARRCTAADRTLHVQLHEQAVAIGR